MELSVIIVSYNVLPFLRQCLASVRTACDQIDYEIIVIDNQSHDGSAVYLTKHKDHKVQVLLNERNTGYGNAMNQGIGLAKGEHLLFLNPDTIVSAESILRSIQKLKSDPHCGAVGVRMMDGKGKYLKESKRGYPTALSSFYKMSGLSSLFPKSRDLAHYHQGHLDEEKNHKIDILTGAFFMTRKKLMDQLRGFDERYFMYGEDIDLSHSIRASGHYNFYIGDTSIIHFKGESTRKDSLENTYHFYHSMLLFNKKYSSGNVIYVSLLSLVLIIIGVIRWSKLNVLPILKPVFRFGVYGLVFFGVSRLWGSLYFGDPTYFTYQRHAALISGYGLLMTIGYYLGDDRFRRLKNLLWAVIAILVIYSLLPLYLRSSRAVIVFGAVVIIGLEVIHHVWISWQERGTLAFWSIKRSALILGSYDECIPVLDTLRSQKDYDYLGIVSDNIRQGKTSVTNFEYLKNYLNDHKIDTITMHMESMSMSRILKIISEYGPSYQYLLYSSKTNSIIDSPDSNSQGTVSIVEISWAIASPSNRRVKRAIDILTSTVFILSSPFLIWFINDKLGLMSNIYQSMLGKTSWVGYSKEDEHLDELPKLRPAVISLSHASGLGHFENVAYARDYSYLKDISAIITGFRAIGNKVEINAKS